MKIAILSPFHPYRGGIAQFSDTLYAELQKEGHEVRAFNFTRLYPDFLFPGKSQYAEERTTADTVDNIRILDSCNPASYFRTTAAIRDFAPDILIISYWMSFFVPAYAHIANRMKKRCTVIALIHNAIPHEPRPFDRPLAKLFFHQCDGFIVMSDYVRNDLLRLRPDAKYLLHPHPLYDRFGKQADKEQARKLIDIPETAGHLLLFFGLIRDYKGLDLLLDAMPQLEEKGFHLLVAGDCYGDEHKYLQKIDTLKPGSVIFSNRYIPDKEVPLLFSAADALVLPYRSATQSGVASIAYQYNLPIVATPVGEFPEAIGQKGTGVITKGNTPKDITEGILHLFENKEYYQQCLQHIEKEKQTLSWKHFTSEILRFTETI